MKHDLSCFDQNSSVDDCCLNCSSSTLLAGCINLFINFMLNVSSIIQSRVPCVLSRMWSHMRYGKLLNYKDAHEQEDVFLSVPAESNSGKSWHFKLPLMFFDLLQSGERDEISPICFIAVPLVACLLALDVDPSIWSSLAADGWARTW